jgi:acetyl esterase/lipase
MYSEDILEMPPPSDFVRLNYGPDRNQFGDLRLPASSNAPFPVVVFVHGGYWRAKYGLGYAGHLCASLAEAGIASWNIEYRRIGNEGGGWPGTFLDVAKAADYLREFAGHYSLDLNRVIFCGHSAGGHLACWLAGRTRVPAGAPLYTPGGVQPLLVVSLAGVLNLHYAWEKQLSDNVTEQFLGGTPEQYPERYATASPFALLPLGVKQVLVHGSHDTSVPYEISELYYRKALELGDAVELISQPGAGHFEMIDPRTPEWRQVLNAIQACLS